MLTANPGLAQRLMGIKMTTPTVCYAHNEENPCFIPPPEEFNRLIAGARTKNSNIEVNYNPGFSPEAQAAFQYAIDIWESLIVSSVPIKIDAYWTPLASTVLGGALYTSAYANFEGAQKLNVFYPVALAEKITGRNLNGEEADLFIQFNSNANWNYNPVSTPAAGQFDLATVVLHEIGHGLGFSGSFTTDGTTGTVGLQSSGVPIIYDIPIENLGNFNLIRSIPSPSTDLHSELTSNNLFFNSPTTTRPKLYAPTAFSAGSSISHLDEVTYNNSADALMTPNIAPLEVIRNPGVAWNMLKDLGWEMARIIHQPLPDRENVSNPFLVTATIAADNSYQPGSVKLNYTTNGTTFTSVDMVPTGNPDEFSASIPATGAPQQYGYYIQVNDNNNRQFVNPGKFVRELNSELQNLFVFETGPDTKPPVITHVPRAFILDSETTLTLEARVTDNIAISSVKIEYTINNVLQPVQLLTLQSPPQDSIYSINLNVGSLINGDEIQYRIVAIDASSNQNESTSPATGFYSLNVVGLEPTQDSYANDFNTPTTDFFGTGFSIAQPNGFNDPAIHSTHPYPEGDGSPNDEINLIYQLKIPVRIKEKDAFIKFDEIVLVEPGESGTVFGNTEFYDFVVVEGSKDGGITWTPVADGYDSRANTVWLTRYNSAISGNNSTATGDASLYRNRTIDLQTKFNTNDEVVIRFRLYSDPFAAGWGWAIDNLKIQIDDIPPILRHDHIDYLVTGTDELQLTMTTSDPSGIESLRIEYRVNESELQVQNFNVFPPATSYTFSLNGLSALAAGDLVEYRIVSADSAGNINALPSLTEFIQVPIITFGNAIGTYSNNFDSPTNDFVGNFFSITQPSGFVNGAIHSRHSYPLGFGLEGSSSFTYTMKKPVTLNASNPFIRFDEIVIVEGHTSSATFPSSNFKDYVIVEGSKDGGTTWARFLDGYDIVGGDASWTLAFNSGTNGNAGMFRRRVIDLTNNGNFQPGNEVIIRFRLFSNESITGWGWAIDNLYIQDPITSAEQLLARDLKVYPNPVLQDKLTIEAENTSSADQVIELINAQGQKIYSTVVETKEGKMRHQIDFSGFPAGIYFIRIQTEQGGSAIRKIIKTN
jgi:hypothetical protein